VVLGTIEKKRTDATGKSIVKRSLRQACNVYVGGERKHNKRRGRRPEKSGKTKRGKERTSMKKGRGRLAQGRKGGMIVRLKKGFLRGPSSRPQNLLLHRRGRVWASFRRQRGKKRPLDQQSTKVEETPPLQGNGAVSNLSKGNFEKATSTLLQKKKSISTGDQCSWGGEESA